MPCVRASVLWRYLDRLIQRLNGKSCRTPHSDGDTSSDHMTYATIRPIAGDAHSFLRWKASFPWLPKELGRARSDKGNHEKSSRPSLSSRLSASPSRPYQNARCSVCFPFDGRDLLFLCAVSPPSPPPLRGRHGSVPNVKTSLRVRQPVQTRTALLISVCEHRCGFIEHDLMQSVHADKKDSSASTTGHAGTIMSCWTDNTASPYAST